MKFLQWLQKDFLGYLDDWEASVTAREGFSEAEKASMTLSKETVEGLRLTGVYMYLCIYMYIMYNYATMYMYMYSTCIYMYMVCQAIIDCNVTFFFFEATRYLLTLPGVTGQSMC